MTVWVFNYLDTIVPVAADVECIIKKSCNDHNKRKIISNKWRKSNIHNYESRNSIKMDEVNTKVNFHTLIFVY